MYEGSEGNANSSLINVPVSNRKNADAINSRWPMVFQALVVVLLLWNAVAQSLIASQLISLQSAATMNSLKTEIAGAVSSGISDGVGVALPHQIGKFMKDAVNDLDLSAMTETVLAFNFGEVATNITTILNGQAVANGLDIYVHISCLIDHGYYQSLAECVQDQTNNLKVFTNIQSAITSVAEQIARLTPPIDPEPGSEPKHTVSPLGVVQAVISKVVDEFDSVKWEKLAPSCDDLEARLQALVDPVTQHIRGVYTSSCELREWVDSEPTTYSSAASKRTQATRQLPSGGDGSKEEGQQFQPVYTCNCPVGHERTSDCQQPSLVKTQDDPPQFSNKTCTCMWDDRGYLTEYVISSMDTICKALSNLNQTGRV